jgi:hypothetical protein
MSEEDLDLLLNHLIEFAQDQLKKRSEFHPFGAAVEQNGSVALIMGYADDENNTAQEQIDLMVAHARELAAKGEIRAIGICLDMRITLPDTGEKTDAICVQLEHRDGQGGDAFLPYKKGFLGRYTYGETVGQKRDFTVFEQKD